MIYDESGFSAGAAVARMCECCLGGFHEQPGVRAEECSCSCHGREVGPVDSLELPNEAYDPPVMGRFEDEPR